MGRQWSYSSLSNYEKCPQRYYLSKIAGEPDDPGYAARRGTRIHSAIEEYLKHESDELPREVFETFGTELENAREKFGIPEFEFAFDDMWGTSNWDDAWCRGKIDLLVEEANLVVDFKTGKKYSGHRDQAALYALATMLLTNIEEPVVEFWYIDLDEVQEWVFRKSDKDRLLKAWGARARKLDEEEEWAPRPGSYCKWCPFSSNKGGQCPVG